jgi:hypothetical protein
MATTARPRPRPCVWAVVVRRLRWDSTIERYRVVAGPFLDHDDSCSSLLDQAPDHGARDVLDLEKHTPTSLARWSSAHRMVETRDS